MKRLLPTTAVLATAVWAASALAAIPQGPGVTPRPLEPQVQNGISFMSGGVGIHERAELRQVDGAYNVRIALTRPDGAYLSGVQVAIENAAGKELVETTTSGPILLAQLQPGRYRLRAVLEGRIAERRLINVPGKQERVRLYVALPKASK